MTRPQMRIVQVPMLDTGIGQEAGYKDDASLIAAVQAERAAMPPYLREMAERIDRDIQHAFIHGTPKP